MKPMLLVAANDPLCLDVYGQLFSDHGYAVVTVADGLNCVTQLQRWAPEVLVLESELPWGGATGVLARMREDSDIAATPVVLVGTSGIPPSDILSSPVFACLPKPFRLETLLETVADAVTANGAARHPRAPEDSLPVSSQSGNGRVGPEREERACDSSRTRADRAGVG